jgi:HSP20 family protein
MAYDLIPGSVWNWPTFRFPAVFDEDEDSLTTVSQSGISISEDDLHVYVTAALPGVKEEAIDMTFNKGILWVKGETKEEESAKNRKYYRKAVSSYSYRIAVPGELDTSKEPEAAFTNGVLTVQFFKSPSIQPKKITFKKSK